MAVSKTKSPEEILAVYPAGQRHFGENYVQELVRKYPALPSDIRWHFIGHLQSNKCKDVARVPGMWCVETVDSLRLALKLDRACEAAGRPEPLGVMIQVNTSTSEDVDVADGDGVDEESLGVEEELEKGTR